MDFSQSSVPVFLSLTSTIFKNICTELKRPFIDEIFHLRQCQTYCRHDFFTWDQKITTPPGLYILGTVYSHILRAFGLKNSCGYNALRSLNLVGGVLILPWILSRVKTFNYWKINIISLPILYSYYFLFYTDVWSTILVIASVISIFKTCCLKGAIIANILGFCSLWFRQTNIVWIAFTGLYMIDTRRKKHASTGKNITSFINQAIADWKWLIPFCMNGVLFAVFIKINGGITFGDKENHQVTFHLVQIFYCFTFLTFITCPVWFGRETLMKYLKFTFSGNRFCNSVLTFLSFLIIRYVIQNYTIVHPFLLADNRHYTFYVYRKILSKPHADLLMVPVYHFSTWLVADSLIANSKKSTLSVSPLLALGFFGSVILTLVPSPLFEPRYYIVPLVLFRVFIQPVNVQRQRHLCEFLWYSMINMIFFIIFFSYEFTWLSEPGVQRIIW